MNSKLRMPLAAVIVVLTMVSYGSAQSTVVSKSFVTAGLVVQPPRGPDQTVLGTGNTTVLLSSRGSGKAPIRRSAVTSVTFPDETIGHFSVGAPWWSWLWLGLIYQPAKGNLTTYKNVQEQVHPWWCLWLCEETQTVQQPVNAQQLLVEALGYTANPSGEQVTDQGQDSCTSCSSVTHYVHNFGFPAPPWAGGGGFKGIGFRGTAAYQEQALILHDHWGTDKTALGAPAFPPDFD